MKKKQILSISTSLKIVITSITLLSFASCASYRAASLNSPTAEIMQNAASAQDGVAITAKAFSKEECKIFLDRDVMAEGYQPVQLYIDNKSDKNYFFSLDRVNTSLAKVENVAESVHTSTVTRATLYGAGALVFLPLAIPAVVDGVKSSNANDQLDMDYAAKSAKDTLVLAHSHMNSLLFIPKSIVGNKVTLTLVEQVSNQPVTFDVAIIP